MSPRDAVRLIRDGDVVAASGLGAHQRASIIYWAIRETFEESGHPAGLTVMNLGGHGGRGIAPGTLEELGRARLVYRRLITGHFETFRAMLELAEAGNCELQCIPQGTMALLFDALGAAAPRASPRPASGRSSIRASGRARVSRAAHASSWSRCDGNRLRYRIPKIDVARVQRPGGGPPRQPLHRALRDDRREPRDRARSEAQPRQSHRQRRAARGRRPRPRSSSRPTWSTRWSTTPTPSRPPGSSTATTGRSSPPTATCPSPRASPACTS